MDSSQDTTQQGQQTDQPINRAQPPVTSTAGQQTVQQDQPTQQPTQQPPQIKMPQSISVNKEGQSVIIQEVSDSGEDDEEELKVSPQETKTQVVGQQGGVAIEEENVEKQPVSEVGTESVETEKTVEEAPESEKPPIPEKAQKPEVTHSGPGVITVDENPFGVKKMPSITYQQAAFQEKKTGLHDSRHWFMAMMMYIWRKLKPGIEKSPKLKVDPFPDEIKS